MLTAERLRELLYYDPSTGLDHINLDKADNRRVNLREATTWQNQANRRVSSNSTSGFKGAHLAKINRKWRARIRVGGKRINLGCFFTPEEANAAYYVAALKYHGEFARAA